MYRQNIQKNNDNSHHNIKLTTNLVETDPIHLLSLLSIYYGINFKKRGSGYRSIKHKGAVSVYKSRSGVWMVKSHNPVKLDVPEGGVKAQIKHLLSNRTGLTRNEIVRALGANVDYLAPQEKEESTTSKENIPPTPTAWITPYGKAIFNTLKEKTGASLETLKKYGVKPILQRNFKSGNSFVHNTKRPCIGYYSKGGVKLKHRNKDGDKEFDTSKTNSPYCFGLEQLPKSGQTLIICAGEDDTICLNHHFNKHDIWAVSFWSENTNPNKRLLNSFKKRFKRVYCLFDYDTTGLTRSAEISNKNGLIWVDVAFLYSVLNINQKENDVCDIYKSLGTSGLHKFIRCALSINDKITRFEDDPFSIEVPHIYSLEIDQYIAEDKLNSKGINPVLFLESALRNHKRLIIQSLAGTGKSFWIKKLIQTAAPRLEQMEFIRDYLHCNRLVLAQPTTAIAQELATKWEQSGIEDILLVMGNTKVEPADIESARVVIVVYDSLPKIFDLENALLVVDEFHQLANDCGYRHDAMTRVFQAMNTANKTVLLSATPVYAFASGWHEKFNYKLIQCRPQKTNKLTLRPLIHDCPKRALYDFIEGEKENFGVTCIKRDNVNELQAFQNNLSGRGIKSSLVSSKDKTHKSGNPFYQFIMGGQKPQEMPKFLLFTTVFEAGVSFNFPVARLCILDVAAWSKVIQLSNRPRQNFNLNFNTNIEVLLFISSKRKTVEKGKTPQIKARFLDLLRAASYQCDVLNGLNSKDGKTEKLTFEVKSDLKKFAYKDATTGKYIEDIPQILHELYLEETSETDTQTLLKRIQRFDSRFTIQPIEAVHIGESPQIKQALNEIKATKEESREEFLKLIRKDYTLPVAALIQLSKDVEYKRKAKRVFLLNNLDKEDLKHFVLSNPKAYKHKAAANKIVKQAFRLIQHGSNIIDALALASNDPKELDRYLEQSTIKRRCSAARKGHELQSTDLYELEKYKVLTKKFDRLMNNLQQGKRKNRFTSIQIARLVNDCLIKKGIIKRPLKPQTAIKQIKPLYDIKYKFVSVKGVKKWYYVFQTLGRAKIEKPSKK